MICPVCGVEFIPKTCKQRYCSSVCQKKNSRKQVEKELDQVKESLIKDTPVCAFLLSELVEENIVVEYRNYETGSKYFGLKPRWRREIHRLGEPAGFTSYVLMESQK